MLLTRCDVIIREFRRCVANHYLMNPADLCGHVRQQVRASTSTSTHIQFRTWVQIEGLVRVYLALVRSLWCFLSTRHPKCSVDEIYETLERVSVLLSQHAFFRRHPQQSSFMHGGLRVDFIVSAPKRDAENVPRLTERSPRKRHAMRGQVQDQPARRSACEAGLKRSTCGRLPARCRVCLFFKNNPCRPNSQARQCDLNLAER